MTRGPKPKPSHLKVVTGNPGKRALNEDEPKPTAKLDPKPTACPKWITGDARKQWKYVVDLLGEVPGVSKKPDEAAAGLMCQAITDFVDATKALKENGSSYQDVETKSGGIMTRIHPAVGVRQNSFKEIMRICAEFGLTPSSRTRLKADLGEGKKNPNDKYFK